MPRFLLVLLFAASLALVGCGGHYHGPEITYEGTFNTSSEIGGDKQVTLRLYENGVYLTRTVYMGQSDVPVVEAGTWALDGETLMLNTERIDGESTPHATTVFAMNADDLEAVAINGSPIDYVWAHAEGDLLSAGLEPPTAHDDAYGDGHGGDAEGDHGDDHSDEVHSDEAESDHGDDHEGEDHEEESTEAATANA